MMASIEGYGGRVGGTQQDHYAIAGILSDGITIEDVEAEQQAKREATTSGND